MLQCFCHIRQKMLGLRAGKQFEHHLESRLRIPILVFLRIASDQRKSYGKQSVRNQEVCQRSNQPTNQPKTQPIQHNSTNRLDQPNPLPKKSCPEAHCQDWDLHLQHRSEDARARGCQQHDCFGAETVKDLLHGLAAPSSPVHGLQTRLVKALKSVNDIAK